MRHLRHDRPGKLMVTLPRSVLANALLRAEYPLSVGYITENGDKSFTFCGSVAAYQDVGRFVMGLINEITIVDSPELDAYVEGEMERALVKMRKRRKAA